VLKITRISPAGRQVTLKLEGELLEPWVSSVRDNCASPNYRAEPVCLDLAAVTYADTAGAQLLRDLLREGVKIMACSSFVRELLEMSDY
jgi:ABC-type transporter Mla MlaB component